MATPRFWMKALHISDLVDRVRGGWAGWGRAGCALFDHINKTIMHVSSSGVGQHQKASLPLGCQLLIVSWCRSMSQDPLTAVVVFVSCMCKAAKHDSLAIKIKALIV